MAPRVSDAIKEDHRELEQYYERITQSSDQDEQTRYQNLFTWELARHSIGEELVKEQLKKFQNLKASDADFIPTLEALMKDLAPHIKEEESTDLPALEEALSPEESEKLSKSFGRTKMFVPSRSHPSAPSKPPYETAVGLLAAPIDHLADLFRKWPDTSTMPNPSTE
ncbi:unnamed protein product [Aspergillus oryzae]|uniref:Unnamed protein product n=2 Tax=Aspergillus oryzae TaxID=5062 RepID=A0AAN5BXS6_ASPOZ|nr:unnamed protein product [Aspergillus oryzae]GMF92607.1 unnamed protein product [Aspergillus oryzae]GMG08177.1 unnamed protein product [Aspergillus oryzae]GMG29436.1 unnamed protein product [Aspergillus oryzae]GMG53817.1 unnamed protein product [Aspergillus oryzae var. brunneus]